MSLIGKIQTLFSDKERTTPVFPRTKVKAVSDDDGKGLDAILEELQNGSGSIIPEEVVLKTGSEMTGNLNRKEQLLLTHIPVGTTNDIGGMLGYTKNILDNVKLSLNGTIKPFDIGIINNHPFIYIAGFGKYTNISYQTPRDLKKKIGHLAYIKEGIKEFFHKTKLYDITYEIDGEKYRGLFSFILISNANHIAGVKNIYKDIKLDDDKFEAVFCTIRKPRDVIKSIYFLTKYGPSKVPGIYFYKTNNLKLTINNTTSASWCVDGEELPKDEHNKYTIKTVNHVNILIPNKNINKLFLK